MANKNSVADWDVTPINNDNVGGVDISEGCAPSGINNALRAIMGQVKLFYSDVEEMGGELAEKATIAELEARLDGLLGAAPAQLDTLVELAAALGDDANFSATISAALGARVRVDAEQPLTTTQQSTARSNIRAASTDVATPTADGLMSKEDKAKVGDPWALQPVGVPIAVMENIAGVGAPPTDKAYRYIKLTASDAYNAGVLTGESVSGSAPNLLASATVALDGSPLNGKVVPLINTERRFVRAGSPGVRESGQNLAHNHGGASGGAGAHSHTYSRPTIYYRTQWGTTEPGLTVNEAYSTLDTSTAPNHTHSITTDGGSENRPSNIGATYYMRIK